jgi:inosine/xanthosine triphosphate pyrophosphatase family protein
MRLLLGSTNAAKLARLRWLFADTGIEVVEPDASRAEPAVEEGDQSVADNAARKAAAWAQAYDLPCAATDGGLCVPGLGDRWNAVLTRRAAGPGASDADRAHHLLGLVADLAPEQRQAFHLEALAIADARGGLLANWEVEGSPRPFAADYDPTGTPRGFWIPGVLLYPGGRRFGELSPEEQAETEDHWVELRRLVRDWAAALPVDSPGR